MSVTGPGCPACGYRGTVALDARMRSVLRPCHECSLWMRPDAFPDAALCAKADRILVDPESASPEMRAWALRLVADGMEAV